MMTKQTDAKPATMALNATVKRHHINLMLAAMEACAEAWDMEVFECHETGPNGAGSHPRMMAYLLVSEQIKDANLVGNLFNKTGGGIWYGIKSIKDAISVQKDTREKAAKARELFKKYST